MLCTRMVIISKREKNVWLCDKIFLLHITDTFSIHIF